MPAIWRALNLSGWLVSLLICASISRARTIKGPLMNDLDELIAEARNSFKATNASANLIYRLANALEAAGAERDAVLAEIEIIKEHREKWMARALRVEDERDAALAAVERVRAIHVEREHRTLDGTYLGGTVCDGCRRPWPCPTVAALDGAPEPEVKP